MKDMSTSSDHDRDYHPDESTATTTTTTTMMKKEEDEMEIEMEELLPGRRRNNTNQNNNNNNNFKRTAPIGKRRQSKNRRFFDFSRRQNNDDDYDYDDDDRTTGRQSLLVSKLPIILLVLFVGVGIYVSVFTELLPWSLSTSTTAGNSTSFSSAASFRHLVPEPLVKAGIYNLETDFQNEDGIRPTYWEPDSRTWGPCYPPPNNVEWKIDSTITSHTTIVRKDNLQYASYSLKKAPGKTMEQKQSGAKLGDCRPGFLIIGAGKCGTSSLYHYLVDGHPRILPASEKQIHYFKYYLHKPLAWYYSYFPTTKSFLEHGGLMTGEASPGYLPYPQVVKDIVRLMSERRRDGSVTLPKIIMIGREPLDRMYSSYRYNYVQPTLEAMSKGQIPGISKKLSEEEYKTHLFSLEDFVRTELKQLKRCLGTFGLNRPTESTIGFGARKTYSRWLQQVEFKQFVNDRYVSRFQQINSNNETSSSVSNEDENTEKENSWNPPLIDLDGQCYGGQLNETVYREQWAELQTQHPDKVIVNRNLHLTQAMIGRGLYTYPLEWWYLLFQPDDIYFVCTEELSDPTVLEDLTKHLGLPPFGNFSGVVSGGAYNVGGHRGYDQATSWDEIQSEAKQRAEGGGGGDDNGDGTDQTMTNGIPIPPDLYKELQEFVEPINERLFALTGKRCNWKY